MEKHRQLPAIDSQSRGIHAGGHSDFLKVCHSNQRLREQKARLRRRLANLCHPRGLIGGFLVFRRRLKLDRKLHARFELPYAMFIGNDCATSHQRAAHAVGRRLLLCPPLAAMFGVAIGLTTAAVYSLFADPWTYLHATGQPKFRIPAWWILVESGLAGIIAGTLAAGLCAAIVRKRNAPRS